MKIASIAFVGALSLTAACGGGEDDSGLATETNTTSATSAVSATAGVGAALTSGDAATAAGGVFALGASAQTIVVPSAQQARVDREIRPALVGTCECTETGCVFTGCGDGQSYTIDGTIAIDGDAYAFDLDLSVNSGGLAWTWGYDGDLTISDTLLDGHLEGAGGGTLDNPQDGSTIELDMSWSVDYNDVGIEAGCAVSGGLDAEVSYDVSSAQGGASYDGSGSVTFGPACGQVAAG